MEKVKKFLSSPNEYRDEFWESDDLVWIDWREFEESIIEYFNKKLPDDDKIKFRCVEIDKERDIDIILEKDGLDIVVPYADECTDRDTTIRSIQEYLYPKYQIRWYMDSLGSDTLAFCIGQTSNWKELENDFGKEFVNYYFSIIKSDSVMFNMNIDDIKRLTGRIPLDENARTPKASVEFSVRGTPKNKECMKAEFMKLSTELEMDISFQEDSMYRRMRRLICFDMDSTLIETEVIDELAIRAGVGDQVKAITEAAMRGEIDFCESFRQRCALLKGLDVSVMQEIAENLPITEGVDRLMRILKKVGFKIAILSGGFTYFGNFLKQKYNIDYVYANELEIENGKLTGNHVGDIVDGKRKAELLRLIAQVENVDIRQTVAVGDGANDLPMISIAGLGIAFHAKPKVKATAKQSISTIGLDGILYFLGYKDSYLDEQM